MKKAEIKSEDVSRETLEKARKRYSKKEEANNYYLESLLWWNERVNLVSRNVSRETVKEHLVHSLIPLEYSLMSDSSCWVDAGTGGGLPGLPLAIADQGKKWILNDRVQKKVVAVRQMAHLLGLKQVEVVADPVDRIELEEPFAVVSKHAFPTKKLLRLLNGKHWKRLILYKGIEEAEKELAELPNGLSLTLYRFQFGEDEKFYRKKGLLVVDRDG